MLYGYASVFGRSDWNVIIPLTIAHAVAYFGMISLAIKRTQRRFTMNSAVTVVVTKALIMGAGVAYFHPMPDGSFTLAVLLALVTTPTFLHFIYDGFLWTRQHPEAHLIYANTPAGTNVLPFRNPVTNDAAVVGGGLSELVAGVEVAKDPHGRIGGQDSF